MGLSVVGLANANEKTGDLKSSATMQATCSISVNPIGFGAVATPLLSQTAQSEMSVKCSNTSAYTIDLAYGGIYGTGSSPINYNVTIQKTYSNFTSYNISNTDGIYGGLSCHASGEVVFNNMNTAKAYGSNIAEVWVRDTFGACNGQYIKSNTLTVAGSGYSHGVMNGISKGDSLAYSIALPSDANKVWNKGNNAYSSTGNGDNQTIALNAKIVPDKSSSKYLAPDMYLDTVTAVISY